MKLCQNCRELAQRFLPKEILHHPHPWLHCHHESEVKEMNNNKMNKENPCFCLRDGWYFEKLPGGHLKISKENIHRVLEEQLVLSQDDLKSIFLFMYCGT